jgi:hypothetical protein
LNFFQIISCTLNANGLSQYFDKLSILSNENDLLAIQFDAKFLSSVNIRLPSESLALYFTLFERTSIDISLAEDSKALENVLMAATEFTLRGANHRG